VSFSINNSVGIYLERLWLEIAERNSLVKVGVINALERADGLRSGCVVGEIVWDWTEILTMSQRAQKGQDGYLDSIEYPNQLIRIYCCAYQA
jgi:hypothetical protein